MGNGGGWAAEGGLKPLLGLFGLAMSPRSVSHRPKHTQMAKEMSYYHWSELQTHAFHVVPSMSPIVSVVNLHDRKYSLKKTDQ